MLKLNVEIRPSIMLVLKTVLPLVCGRIISASENSGSSILTDRVQIQVGDAKIIIAVVGERCSGCFCDDKVLAGAKTTRGKSKEVTPLSNRQSLCFTDISVIIFQFDVHRIPTSRFRAFTHFDIQSSDAVGFRGEFTSCWLVHVVGPGGPPTILVVCNLRGIEPNRVEMAGSERQVICGSIIRNSIEAQFIKTSSIPFPIFHR